MKKNWSSVRKRLEQDFLAPSLRGRVSYFMTRYTKAHDEAGRLAIRVDGREVLKSGDLTCWGRCNAELRRGIRQSHPELSQIENGEEYWKRISDCCVDMGYIELGDFYTSYGEFENQSIEESLNGANALIRTFAILDRRTGKRRLKTLRDEGWGREPEWLNRFFRLRLDAEGLSDAPGKAASEREHCEVL